MNAIQWDNLIEVFRWSFIGIFLNYHQPRWPGFGIQTQINEQVDEYDQPQTT